MSEIGFIGDVHGSIEQLDNLVQRSKSRVSRFIFLGDYVDRGRFSKSVVEYLITLSKVGDIPCKFLSGHHDEAFLDALQRRSLGGFLRMGGAATVLSYVPFPYGDVGEQLRSAMPRAHVEFLEALVPLVEGEGFVAAHAQERALPLLRYPAGRSRYGIYGHQTLSSLVPVVAADHALIDTGCGSIEGGKLTCFFWPSRTWIQS